MEPRSTETNARAVRLVGIDVLRAVAALAVVVSHLPFSMSGGVESAPGTSVFPRLLDEVVRYGGYGVNLFLVLSGFCIHMQWARRRDEISAGGGVGFLSFWRRRLRRLYPPYFMALVCSIAGLAVMTRLSHAPITGIGSRFGYGSDAQFFTDVVLLVLLAQNLNDASHRIGNGPFWSLALEEQLYLLYFPLLLLRRRMGWTVTLIAVALVTFGWRAAFPLDKAPVYWNFVGPARWFEWTLGALAVEAHVGKVVLPRSLASPVTVVAVLSVGVLLHPPYDAWFVPYGHVIHEAAFSFAAFVLVNWFCKLDRAQSFRGSRVAALLGKLGVMSYSLYLVHVPTMAIVKRAAFMVGIHSVPVIAALRLGLALGATWLFFQLVERHFLNRIGRSPALLDGVQ